MQASRVPRATAWRSHPRAAGHRPAPRAEEPARDQPGDAARAKAGIFSVCLAWLLIFSHIHRFILIFQFSMQCSENKHVPD